MLRLNVVHIPHIEPVGHHLHPERYPPPPPDWVFPGEPFDHTDHCLNYIRESIMCHADTTYTVFQWEEWRHKSFAKFDTLKVCRNWESVQQWAVDHMLLESFDDRIHVNYTTPKN